MQKYQNVYSEYEHKDDVENSSDMETKIEKISMPDFFCVISNELSNTMNI